MLYKRPGTHGFGAHSRLSNIKILETTQRYIILSCVLVRNVNMVLLASPSTAS